MAFASIGQLSGITSGWFTVDGAQQAYLSEQLRSSEKAKDMHKTSVNKDLVSDIKFYRRNDLANSRYDIQFQLHVFLRQDEE